MDMQHAVLKIQNVKGLHARATAKFVKTVESFNCQIYVQRHIADKPLPDLSTIQAKWVDGSSILGLMMLAAERESKLDAVATGKDASNALAALTILTDNKFGEDDAHSA